MDWIGDGDGDVKITAKDLLKLLARRHTRDVFVPECMTTAAPGESYQRLDAWAIKRAWTNPLATGYEIKVSRSDFLQDDKWRGYLPYCNELYFVCPPKLIQPEELPADVGLLWCSLNAARLYSKRKAAWRDVEIPESLYRYVLFSRVRVVDESDGRQFHRDYWQRWLTERKVDAEFGRHVSRTIRRVVENRIDKVEIESECLKRQMGQYECIKQFLREQGIVKGSGYVSQWHVRRKILALQEAVPIKLLGDIAGCRDELSRLWDALNELATKPTEGES